MGSMSEETDGVGGSKGFAVALSSSGIAIRYNFHNFQLIMPLRGIGSGCSNTGGERFEMITDRLPRSKGLLDEFEKSDRMTSIALPEDGRLVAFAKGIEEAMVSEERAVVSLACQEFVAAAAPFYGVPKPTVRVLASRPLRLYESGWSTELFGDYEPGKNVIRVWMRTSVRKQVTSHSDPSHYLDSKDTLWLR